jgi:L-ribulokinase
MGETSYYDALFAEYQVLHDHFGTRGLLHRLRRIRDTAHHAG